MSTLIQLIWTSSKNQQSPQIPLARVIPERVYWEKSQNRHFLHSHHFNHEAWQQSQRQDFLDALIGFFHRFLWREKSHWKPATKGESLPGGCLSSMSPPLYHHLPSHQVLTHARQPAKALELSWGITKPQPVTALLKSQHVTPPGKEPPSLVNSTLAPQCTP